MVPARTSEGVGEGDAVALNRPLHLARHPYYGARGVDDLDKFLRSPSLPFPRQRVASFECEASVIGERQSNRGERCSQVAVFDQDLERVAGHHDQVELSIETY